MNKLNNLTILSASKFVPAILAVADNMVPAFPYPPRDFDPAILASGRHVVSGSDGAPSYKQDRKGGFRCAPVIPANRPNRKTRRTSAKLKLHKAVA